VGAVGVRLGAASVAPVRGRCLSSRRRLGGNVYLPRDRALSVTPGERHVPLSATPLHIFTPAAPETGRAHGQTRRAGVDTERSRERNHALMTSLASNAIGLGATEPRVEKTPRRPRIIMEGPLVSDTTEVLSGAAPASEDPPIGHPAA
jgi:hypothetical protein